MSTIYKNSIEQKKITLEKFIYCNSSQLFKNNNIDLKQFIRINYEKFSELVERLDSLEQEIHQKRQIISQVGRSNNTIINYDQEIKSIKDKIEQHQIRNRELKTQLSVLNGQIKKDDFLEEYQDICKQVNELRVQLFKP